MGGGSFWQPYLVGSGWSPYANGVWAFYPGAGYSWVSPYPWGWLPYHSGSWSFLPGYGWGWQPGGPFNGLNNVANGMMGSNGMMPGGSNGMMPTGSMAGGNAATNGFSSGTRRPTIPQAPSLTGATRQSLVLQTKSRWCSRNRTGRATLCSRRTRRAWAFREGRWGV